MRCFVYIIYSESRKKYYKGITNNFNKRLKEHNSESNSGYTSSGKPWIKILVIEKPNRLEAIILERKLKNLNKERLEIFIKNIYIKKKKPF
ncbi:GIY-YIG nuclease family protein [Winogradskyella immobilis]|uniref:GIY-YIG nuclease family protein n=1 Tax=Winogradskyella immobilis TaxID=2816852 RepID=A0ABS8EMV8_9FLAO|nr:GIY-YIG nuclease family protein [Winogradskyella immobilis]MCG0016348.1 GIY-YIG nuclease family protein [Winogradskyella immobilis]